MNKKELIKKVLDFQKKENVSVVLHGGSALMLYGLREETNDIDCIISRSSYLKLKDKYKLTETKYPRFSSISFGDFDLSFYGFGGYQILKSGILVYDIATLIEERIKLVKLGRLKKDLDDYINLRDLAIATRLSVIDRDRVNDLICSFELL